MKKVLFVAIFIGLSLVFGKLLCLAGEEYFQAKFMPASEAEKKWGITKFDVNRFKTGSAAQQAPMAVDIVKRRLYVGQDRRKVRDELGEPTGYFFSDTIYAYQIEEYSETKKEAWQLVFIPDKDLKNVADVKIHKKCCYETPEWAK